MDALVRFAEALFGALAESAPYLVLGYLAVALIHEFVPAQKLVALLGGRGARPLLNALGIGALLPVCSCGSIPIGIGLSRSGAATGTVLALMTSSPAISPVSLALGYTLLGPQLLLTLVGVVLVGSFLIGLIGNLWLPTAGTTNNSTSAAGSAGALPTLQVASESSGPRLRRAFRWAYWDLGADVSLDLLIGLSVAAAVLAFVPAEWISALLGERSHWALLCVILVSVPMYTCSVPAMLIVRSLLVTGAGPGAAVAFLVAGPASNLGEINAIRGSMGNRAAAYYSVALVVVALAGGIITDQVVFRDGAYIPPAVETMATAGHEHHLPGLAEEAVGASRWQGLARRAPVWHYPFVVVLVVVMALGIVRRIQRMRSKADCCNSGEAMIDLQ